MTRETVLTPVSEFRCVIRCAYCGKLLSPKCFEVIEGERYLKHNAVYDNVPMGILLPVHPSCKRDLAVQLQRDMEEGLC